MGYFAVIREAGPPGQMGKGSPASPRSATTRRS
jgi:hypothetical protein